MSRMCWGCGYDDVPDDEDECPNCGDKVPSGRCPYCGEEMYPSYHHICKSCGRDERDFVVPYTPLPEEMEDVEKPDEPEEVALPPTETPAPPTFWSLSWSERWAFLRRQNRWYLIFQSAFILVSILGLLLCISVLGWKKYGIFFERFMIFVVWCFGWYIGYRFFKALSQATIREKSPFLAACFLLLWAPAVYGIQSVFAAEYAYYAARSQAITDALQAGQQAGDWGKAVSIVEPYRWEEDGFEDVYAYCVIKNEIAQHEDWKSLYAGYHVEDLPASIQADAKQIQTYIAGYKKYIDAKEKLEKLKQMNALVGYMDLQKNELKSYTDDEVPPEYRADAAAMRQEVAQLIAEKQPLIDAANEAQRQKRIASEERAKAEARRMASQPKSQKAQDEEDYSRGYDDGRFSASEGIWEDYDENESEAYINGYQDGQGEAREELEDERQRQAEEQAQADAKAKKRR